MSATRRFKDRKTNYFKHVMTLCGKYNVSFTTARLILLKGVKWVANEYNVRMGATHSD